MWPSDHHIKIKMLKLFAHHRRRWRTGTCGLRTLMVTGAHGLDRISKLVSVWGDWSIKYPEQHYILRSSFNKTLFSSNMLCVMSTVCIVHNIFNKRKENRTMSLDSQQVVLFKNPHDNPQISTLTRRMYPGYFICQTPITKLLKRPTDPLWSIWSKLCSNPAECRPIYSSKTRIPPTSAKSHSSKVRSIRFTPFAKIALGLVFATAYYLCRHIAQGCNRDDDLEEKIRKRC